MDADTWKLIGTAAMMGAAAMALLLLWGVGSVRRARLARRLYWITQTNATFARWVVAALEESGYRVCDRSATKRGEVILKLADPSGRLSAAVVFPGLFPVTSDQVGLVMRTMAGSRARHATLFTRATFTPAAVERTKGQPISLVDRDGLPRWIEQAQRPRSRGRCHFRGNGAGRYSRASTARSRSRSPGRV